MKVQKHFSSDEFFRSRIFVGHIFVVDLILARISVGNGGMQGPQNLAQMLFSFPG